MQLHCKTRHEEILGAMRLSIRIFIMMIVLAPGHTGLAANDYWIQVEGGACAVWSDEEMGPADTVTWSGACRDGKADGRGKSSHGPTAAGLMVLTKVS